MKEHSEKARRWKSRFAGVLVLFEIGCATPFQAKSFTGGYSDARIAKDTVLVSFKGNGFTPKERVQLYLLYRCAEVTVQDGFDYFVINDGNTEAKVNYIQTPSTYNENTTGYAYASGNSAYGSAQTFGTVSSGQAFPVHKYGAEALIKCSAAKSPRAILTHMTLEKRFNTWDLSWGWLQNNKGRSGDASGPLLKGQTG